MKTSVSDFILGLAGIVAAATVVILVTLGAFDAAHDNNLKNRNRTQAQLEACERIGVEAQRTSCIALVSK